MGDWRDDPQLRDVGRELRHRLGDELRRDAEDAERDAARALARARTLGDLAAHLRDRGDEVALTVAGDVLTGTVTAASGDHLQLRTPRALVDVPLGQPLALQVTVRARSGGAQRRGAGGFRARLLELELDGDEVQVRTSVLGGLQRGRIAAVGRDHLALVGPDGVERYITLEAVHYVARAER
ncbi:MAG TPA: hypothetical protein VHF25_14595 [Nitriliruptorales bacterium]|nr:hypothetical protein [Nitriliruptorales bacterium]